MYIDIGPRPQSTVQGRKDWKGIIIYPHRKRVLITIYRQRDYITLNG